MATSKPSVRRASPFPRATTTTPGPAAPTSGSHRDDGRLMDLDFSPEQELLAETVRGVCARHAGLDVVRQLEDDPVGYPEKFWLQLAELGLLDVSELTMLDATVVYFELGRALVPSPHFASSVLSAGLLRLAGSEAQRSEWLPRIA